MMLTGSPGASPVELDTSDSKDLKRQQKRLEDANRQLDSWERYRALNDTMDEAYELVGIANREARFAAILMGALNASVVLLVTRPEVQATIPQGFRIWMGLLLTIYASVAVYFFLSAIEILRPRRYRPKLDHPELDPDAKPAGVRYYEDIILRSAEENWSAWRSVRIGQLSAELAERAEAGDGRRDLRVRGVPERPEPPLLPGTVRPHRPRRRGAGHREVDVRGLTRGDCDALRRVVENPARDGIGLAKRHQHGRQVQRLEVEARQSAHLLAVVPPAAVSLLDALPPSESDLDFLRGLVRRHAGAEGRDAGQPGGR